MQFSASRIMICEFVYKQIFCYLSRIISDSWTNQREKFYLITVILTNIELITTIKDKCLKISWKRSTLTLNTILTKSRIKSNESSIIIAICLKTFNNENMSYMTLFLSKRRSWSLHSCQAHRDLIVYLVTKRRKSEKWERKKELWKLINLFVAYARLLIFLILNTFLDLDHLTQWLTRNCDIIFLSFLIKQRSFDFSCLNDERTLINRFRVNNVSFDDIIDEFRSL
jgi:hypothetical protein